MRLLAAVLLILLAWPVPWAKAGLDPRLGSILAGLRPDEEVSVIATLTDQADHDLLSAPVPPARTMGVGERRSRREKLVSTLRRHAETSQSGIRRRLHDRGVEHVQALWLINGLAFSANSALISELSAMPEVASIRYDEVVQVPRVIPSADSNLNTIEDNVDLINAPALWTLGYTGQGVTVAIMDSGVDVQHPELGPRWRGGFNSWFNAVAANCANPQVNCTTTCDTNTTAPCDYLNVQGVAHGTGVAGVLVGGSAGGTAIGVAPGARWIAAKIFDSSDSAPLSIIHQAFAWLLDPDGNPGTDDAPDVVNISWGFEDLYGVCFSEFQPDVQALRAAGIAMAFAAGNTGNHGGNTSVSPANYPESFAVGAVDQALAVPLFSARGPSACDGTVYPEVVAPGFVRTTDLSFGGIPLFNNLAGTSFSAPHVAGTMALLLSALPGQSVTALEAALRQTATDLGPAGPDNNSGSGMINALAAYTYLKGPTPNISILPSATFFNFGTVPLNGSLAQVFTITNVGNADLLLGPGPIAVTGPNAAEFALINDLCSGRSLVPSAGCTFEVIFSPLSTGKKIAVAAIPSNDPDTSLASIVLVGDERVRIGTFRRGKWFLDNGSGGWDAGGDTAYQAFGAPDDIPVTGDWDGDGRSEVGTYRRGTWYLDNGNGAWDGPVVDKVIAAFGAPTDKPVTGDVDGDDISEVGVYRPATGQWYFDLDNDGWTLCQADGGTDLCLLARFGAPDDVPVTGDWDGNGTFDIGVYRKGTWYLDANGNGGWDGPIVDTVLAAFGAPTDIPVTGDWNGDGRSEVGTYRRGTWYLDNGNGRWDPGLDTVYQAFGAPDDIPVTRNWN
jgi:bacillopeptidase F